jgi:hypothetical protein
MIWPTRELKKNLNTKFKYILFIPKKT